MHTYEFDLLWASDRIDENNASWYSVVVKSRGGLTMNNILDYEKMAMLDLPEAERADLTKRFDDIESSFSALEKYDTSGVEPLITVLDMFSVLREDIAVKQFSREDVLKNAPDQHDGFFQVPATID